MEWIVVPFAFGVIAAIIRILFSISNNTTKAQRSVNRLEKCISQDLGRVEQKLSSIFAYTEPLGEEINKAQAVPQTAQTDPAEGLVHAVDLVPPYERMLFLLRAKYSIDLHRVLLADRLVRQLVEQLLDTVEVLGREREQLVETVEDPAIRQAALDVFASYVDEWLCAVSEGAITVPAVNWKSLTSWDPEADIEELRGLVGEVVQQDVPPSADGASDQRLQKGGE